MAAILRLEMLTYLVTLTGYVFIGFFLLVSGFLVGSRNFFTGVLWSSSQVWAIRVLLEGGSASARGGEPLYRNICVRARSHTAHDGGILGHVRSVVAAGGGGS